jgi:4-hydroxybenzoate polyprenyltransferase
MFCAKSTLRLRPATVPILRVTLHQRQVSASWFVASYTGCYVPRIFPFAIPATKTQIRWLANKSKEEDDQNHNATISASRSTSSSTSDPPMLTWVDYYLPKGAKPYARLARIDKPIGTWLLVWPCFWSTAIASASQQAAIPDLYLCMLFGVGAITMRGAGCTINDLWDKDIDQQVERTRTRPLAGGDLTTSQAMLFLAAQLSIGLGVLVSLPHTLYCLQWGTASLPLVALYPLTKRFLPWPQLFLGLTINWGAWMGWAATHGSMDWSILPFLYGSGVTWTLVYDTLYAHQDKQDDAKLGLNSTALAFGDDKRQKQVLHTLAALTWLQWLAVGYATSGFLSFPIYQVGVTAAYAHLIWQIQTADFDNPHNLAARFRSNSTVGALVFGSIAAGGYYQ